MKREYEINSIKDALAAREGFFSLRGWVKRKREHKNDIFILLRDSTDVMQCVINKEEVSEKDWKDAKKLHIEASIIVQGNLREEKRAPYGVEMHVKNLEVVDFGQEFPIQRDFSEEYLLSVRHLWLRSSKLGNALKVRAHVVRALHDFMKKNGYWEVHCPSFVSGAVEGGATLFAVPYFGKKVYLTQSAQFYLEALIFALEKVYTLAPSFRAEKSRTRRHLTEFWHFEAEAAWMKFKELLDFEEELIKYVTERVLKECRHYLEALGRNPDDLKPVVEEKFPRYTYEEILKIAREKFKDLPYGTDLGEKEEREITKDFNVPILVTHYPISLKPFYHRPDPENPKVALCCDMLAPEGYGEIIGSGERCWKLEELLQRMKEENLNPEQYGWYVDLRKYGSVPHSGFGLGLARYVMWLCKLPHIRDAIAFPRTITRYYP